MEEHEDITLRFPFGAIVGVILLPLKLVSHRHLLLWISPGLGWHLGAGPAALSLALQTHNEPPEPQAWFSLSSACGSHLPWPVVESVKRSDGWQHKSHAELTKSAQSLLNTSPASSGLLANSLGLLFLFFTKSRLASRYSLLQVARKQAGRKGFVLILTT